MVPAPRLLPRTAVAILATACLALADQRPSSAKKVEEVLQAKVSDSDRVARIANVGPDAIPVLLGILGDGSSPFAAQEASIVAALKRFDRTQLLPPILRATSADAPARVRAASIEALGAVGDRRDLPLVCKIASPSATNDDLDPLVEPALRRATAEILLRDFGSYLAIQDLLRSQLSATRLCLYRALADTGAAQSLPILVQRLGADALEDAILLTEIARDSRSVPLPPEIGVREGLRVYLHSDQPVLIQAATASLGNLEDANVVPDLVAQLSHPDSLVRETSHAALCRITGEKLMPDRERWTAWYLSESDWYKKRAAGCIEDLRTGIAVRKNLAIAEMSKHALYREEFTVHVLRMLPHESEALQRQGICALGIMGSSSAVPYLEAQASDSNAELASAAREALQRIRERRPQGEKRGTAIPASARRR
jgi:HEAT repeat protein